MARLLQELQNPAATVGTSNHPAGTVPNAYAEHAKRRDELVQTPALGT